MLPSCSRAGLTVCFCNPTPMQRQEVVELDGPTIFRRLKIAIGDSVIIKDGANQQVDWQYTYDGKLLVYVSTRPHGKTMLTISKGTPAPMRRWVYGALFPRRKDDLAWENDRCAYRLYGPALQRSGEHSYGIDVWTKRSPILDLDHRYAMHLSGKTSVTSFHLDHGNGLDCYGVGESLGCGAPALFDNGRLVMPWCFERCQILENGPLRFTAQLAYPAVSVGADQRVIEHRLVSLDRGSNFCKMTVWYDGLTSSHYLAAGVVLRDCTKKHLIQNRHYTAYADPTDSPEKYGFTIFTSVVFPQRSRPLHQMVKYAKNSSLAGHGLQIVRIQGRQPTTYYFGAAWSEYDVRGLGEWTLRIEQFLKMLQHPLTIKIESRF